MRLHAIPVLSTILLAAATPAQASDLARAQEIAAGRCFLCHGSSGESATEVYPRLASQNATYIARQLRDFQSGQRKGTAMNQMAKGLTEAEMLALGQFYQQQKSDPHPPGDPALAAAGQELYLEGNSSAGVPACASCHGPRAEGTEALPRLAGQVAAYIESQLRQFTRRERTNDKGRMHPIAAKLDSRDARALGEYLASLP